MILIVTLMVIIGVAAVLCCVGGGERECNCDRCRQAKDDSGDGTL